MLHRAGAERIEPGIDGVVLLAEPHIVAHRLGLGQAGQVDRRFPRLCAEPGPCRRSLGEVHAGYVIAADLEEQRLLDLQAAIAGKGALGTAVARLGGRRGTALFVHDSTSFRAAA